jgi:hypothetical protein
MMTVEPLAIQTAGSWMWPVRWVQIDTDTDEILMFTKPECNLNEFCGSLTGDNPPVRLVFDHNGFIRSYFKVFDPDNTCIGTARCLKATAQRIVTILSKEAFERRVLK